VANKPGSSLRGAKAGGLLTCDMLPSRDGHLAQGCLDHLHPTAQSHHVGSNVSEMAQQLEKVFISCSHGDTNFADRLVLDLRASDVPATYDKWLLRIGDSIIQKIAAEVSEDDSVIALLSPASVESNWVKKELALAMAGEVKLASRCFPQ